MSNYISATNEDGTNITTDQSLGENITMHTKNSLKKKLFLILSAVLALVIIVASTYVVVNKFSNQKLTAEEIFDLIAPSTVEINAEGEDFTSTGTGSFIDDKGTVVTNYHVIEGCHTINIKTQDGITYTAENILGVDKDRDLVIIETDCQNEYFIELETNKIKTGEKVYTLGSSLGLTGTFSEGIISAASREFEGLEFIQTTAPISSGNSGGPLVNEYGKVIGITTGAFTEGQNLNLAIPASAIKEINRENKYSIDEFFQISKGEVAEQEDTEDIIEKPVEDEDYAPVDMGYFDSLADLDKAAQRNPNDYKNPVIVSVRGTIARATDDSIFLIDTTGDFDPYLHIIEKYGLEEEDLKERYVPYRVNMIDDTKNRALTADIVIITGVYKHSTKTLSGCTYELLK